MSTVELKPTIINHISYATAGLLCVLAFSPFHQWWLIPCILAWVLNQSQRTPLVNKDRYTGPALFSLCYFLGHLYWLVIPMHDFARLNWFLSILLLFASCSLLGFFMYMTFYTTAKASDRFSPLIAYLLVFPCVWFLNEYLRSMFFPWALIGFSQTTDLSLRWLLPIIGVWGIGWLIALISGMLALLTKYPYRQSLVIFITTLITLVFSLTVATNLRTITEPHLTIPGDVAFTTVQHNEIKDFYHPDLSNESLQEQLTLTDTIAKPNHLIIWPESALPVANEKAAWIGDLKHWLQQRNISLLSGITWYTNQGISPAAILLDDHTDSNQIVYKKHLVPFGETVPFKGIIQPILDFAGIPLFSMVNQVGDYSTIAFGPHVIAPIICYDILFTDQATSSLDHADFGIVLANSSWYGRSIASYQHSQIAQVVAAQANKEIIFATNAGLSSHIARTGAIIDATSDFKTPYLNGHIHPNRQPTLYSANRYNPAMVLSVITNFIAVIIINRIYQVKRRNRRSHRNL